MLFRSVLDVGCGVKKYPGAVGIDRNANTSADVLVDLDQFPYPFRDNSFDHVRAVHVIEHVADVIRTMEEFHRLLRAGGHVFIATPHYTDFSSFCEIMFLLFKALTALSIVPPFRPVSAIKLAREIQSSECSAIVSSTFR